MVQSEGFAGIEPATFRFVAQHINHCATAVPRTAIGTCHAFMLAGCWQDRVGTSF